MVKKSGVEKFGVLMSFELLDRLFNHELFNTMVQKFMVEKSGVEMSALYKIKGHFKP